LATTPYLATSRRSPALRGRRPQQQHHHQLRRERPSSSARPQPDSSTAQPSTSISFAANARAPALARNQIPRRRSRRPHHRIRRRGGRTSPQPEFKKWRRRPAGGASGSVRLRVALLTNVAGKISKKNSRKRTLEKEIGEAPPSRLERVGLLAERGVSAPASRACGK